jgi:hypothetical protein
MGKEIQIKPQLDLREDLPCRGFRIVPYGVNGSGTEPCEHRRYGGRCPDTDKLPAPAIAEAIDRLLVEAEPKQAEITCDGVYHYSPTPAPCGHEGKVCPLEQDAPLLAEVE